jgi:cystathionine beta-lyase
VSGKSDGDPPGPSTRAGHLGRHSHRHLGAVNTPVYRASTILFPTVADLEASARGESRSIGYGLHGLPTVVDFQEAMAALEGGFRALAVPSGLAATTLPLLALAKPGDHVLVTDSVYFPTRRFCALHLARLGVEVEYYDPLIGADIARRFRPNTRIVFTESPGSLTFEVQDIPAIAGVAHERGALVLMDNTWATPFGFRAMDHGVDVSIHAATKYIGGHSDVLLGAIVCNEATHAAMHRLWTDMGVAASSDDCFLGLRGLRTLPTRLARHGGRRVAALASRSPRGAVPRAARQPGARAVAARLRRRVGALRRRPAAGCQGARRCDARRACGLRDGLELGRLREPGDPHLARARSHGHAMGSRRPVLAPRHRPRGPG